MTHPTCDSVVFVDDDADLRHATAQSLSLAGLDVVAHDNASTALATIDDMFTGVVVTDIRMPGMDGLTLFHRVAELDPDIPVILISGHADVSTAVTAVQQGAYDFLTKPYGPALLVSSVKRALEKRRLVLENRLLRKSTAADSAVEPLLGASPAMEYLRRTIAQIADVPVDVLIQGETGTGKGVVAALLHKLSSRGRRPMVTVDCGALPDALVESELFGHVSGAFAGAQHPRTGRIEQANHSTLFLDEVDTMREAVQLKLQRVLETREVVPLGANAPRPVSLRVLAASKADLAALSDAGSFRPSLYYRINGVTLRIPPLRERRDDIVPLFRTFVVRAAARLERDVPTLTAEAWRRLTEHSWPGNVRELLRFAENVVLGLADGEPPRRQVEAGDLRTQVNRFEASLIEDALATAGGDVRTALLTLGIPRKTFYDKVTRHAIDVRRFKPTRPT